MLAKKQLKQVICTACKGVTRKITENKQNKTAVYIKSLKNICAW